jgi:hypothetical protein
LRLVAFDDPLGSSLDEQNAIEAREDEQHDAQHEGGR